MKIVGKPYSGKPNVRFDEGELEIELLATTPALYSTELVNPPHRFFLKIGKGIFRLLLPEIAKASVQLLIPDFH